MTDLRRLLAYTDWGNRLMLDALRAMPEPPPRAVQLMAHLIAAEEVWRSRVERRPAPMAVWPDFGLEEAAERLAQQPEAWRQLLETHAPEANFSYTNSRGEAFESTVGEMILHVVTHAAYHRGQIAQLLRQAGYDPAYTDFIHAVRTGAI